MPHKSQGLEARLAELYDVSCIVYRSTDYYIVNFRLCCCFFSAHLASWTSLGAFPWRVSRWQGCPTGGSPPPRSPPRPRGWPSTSCCSPSRPTTAPSPASRAGPRSPTWLEVTPHRADNWISSIEIHNFLVQRMRLLLHFSAL